MTVTTAPALATLNPRELLRAQVKWRHLETLFWLATLLPFLVAPTYLILGSQIAHLMVGEFRLDWFSTIVGLIFLLGGIWALFSIQVGLVPILCIAAGVALMLSALTSRPAR